MGASAPTTNDRNRLMSRATLPPQTQRTVTVTAVKPMNRRDMIYRDEVFNVKVTLTGTQAYKVKLDLSQGKKEQTLGSRGKVQMYDFENDGILDFPEVTPADANAERTKMLKAVINTAQIVRIKATEILPNDELHTEPAAETEDIHIVHRLRQYTTTYTNRDVNNYDSYIDKWLNYWTDWKIPVPPAPQNPGDPVTPPVHYTFMTDAVPPGDLVKAVTYKESSMTETDLMTVTQTALNGMKTGDGNSAQRDVNAAALPLDYDGGNLQLADTPRMNYGTPTDDTENNSLKWGIRWLIDKRTFQDYTRIRGVFGVKVIDWWGPTGALKNYNGEEDKIVSYPASVEKLYAEGRFPHTQDKPNTPDYLWPIKVDGSARGNEETSGE